MYKCTPEVREYYAIVFLNDHKIGHPSAIVTITVGPQRRFSSLFVIRLFECSEIFFEVRTFEQSNLEMRIEEYNVHLITTTAP